MNNKTIKIKEKNIAPIARKLNMLYNALCAICALLNSFKYM
jgi:hypothetical protein